MTEEDYQSALPAIAAADAPDVIIADAILEDFSGIDLADVQVFTREGAKWRSTDSSRF